MLKPEKLFENFFDSKEIINRRFYHFSEDARALLHAANGGGDYTSLIALIDLPLGHLADELGLLDTHINIGKGQALANKTVMNAFKLVMSDKEGAIADRLGGRDTAAYLEFYPHGITEYSNANKSNMGILTNRVNVAASAHSVALGGTLVTLLTGFKGQWASSRADQEGAIGNVKTDRNDSSKARHDLELVMLTVVHTIAAKFPGDVDTCMSLFNFDKLFRHTHTRVEIQTGTLAPLAIGQISNITLTDNDEVLVKNTDANAKLLAYLGATATSEPELGQGVIIDEMKHVRIKPSHLGPLTNTFLLVKNISHVNDGAYNVSVRGIDE